MTFPRGKSIAATGAVSVAGTGTTLGGYGFIGGDTTMATLTFLSPGTSPGTLTFVQDLTLLTGFQDGGSVPLFTYGTAGALDLTPDLGARVHSQRATLAHRHG